MVDKSFTALPRFISEGILGNLVGTSPPTTSTKVTPDGISRGFELFLQSVRKAKNKYDEGQIVNRELQTLQTSLQQPNISMVQMRDFLCRMVFCHMLGYDVTFGLIHAVKLAQQGSHIDKKTGYLACCLLMHRDHELILLLVNTIQKDLKSSNILENLAGLSACSQLVPVEMIPSVLPMVLDKLRHSRELVRQKAVMCLFQFQLLAPDLLEHNQTDLLKMLFDKDPGVMAAAVYIVQNYIQRNPEKCERFGQTLISILKQISSHKMATMFEYHTMPFPWLQIRVIRSLASLAAVHKSLSTSLPPLLLEILQKTSVKEHIAYAILYECIQCILCINPPKSLLDEAAKHIQRFLVSSQPTLKFIGVKLLVSLVHVNPEYSVNYQQLIVQSLENSDLNVQKKMHKLLYEIANDTNVTVVCGKLLTQLQSSTDKFWRSEVITMVIGLIERFDADVQWQIETVFTCLQNGSDVVSDHILNNVMNVVEKKFLSSGTDERVQKLLVQKCVGILVSNKWSGPAEHVSAWVLGDLCMLLKNLPDDRVISLFTQKLSNGKLAYCVQSSIVTSLQSLVMKGVVSYDTMATKINECLKSELPVVIKQRLFVILGVCKHSLTLNVHDNMDTTLTLLDDIVTEDLERSGNPYVPPHLRGVTQEPAMPSSVLNETSQPEESASSVQPRTESTTSSTKTMEENDSGLRLPVVKQVWGRQGRIDTSSRVNADKTSSTTTPALSEEQIRQQELASSLFGGLKGNMQSTDEADLKTGNYSGFLPNSLDTGGWKSLHSSLVRTLVRTQSSQIEASPITVCNTESPKDKAETDRFSNATDNFIVLENSAAEASLQTSKVERMYSKIDTTEKSDEFKEQASSEERKYNPFNKGETGRADAITENLSVTDLDEAISVLLDTHICDNEQDSKLTDDADGSFLKFDSGSLSENFSCDSKDISDSNILFEFNTSSDISERINSKKGDVQDSLASSIYEDDEH